METNTGFHQTHQQQKAPQISSPKQKRVAIVGAGVAGLACSKECVEEGHHVRVFDQSKFSGGTWVVEPVPTELQNMSDFKKRWHKVCSSMYEDLRTNLPRELMGFLSFPFDGDFGEARDLRPHPCHHEVRRYLEAFKAHFRLDRVIEYESIVVRVEHTNRRLLPWEVDIRSNDRLETARFDAVIVASGHLTVPNIPDIEGIGGFKRRCLHSHLYRNPKQFKDQTVVLLGNSYSGRDLADQIGPLAKAVYFCGRRWSPGADLTQPIGERNNVYRCGTIEECVGEGQLRVDGGRVLQDVDVLIFCTGYVHDYPFLKGPCSVSTENRVVYPLYKQMLHARLPSICFPRQAPIDKAILIVCGVVIQTNIIPFALAEYQAKYIARVFSERIKLPDSPSMVASVDRCLAELEEQNRPLEDWVLIGVDQFAHMNDLADLCGDVERVPEWWERMRDLEKGKRENDMSNYRDVRWDDPCYEEARMYHNALRRRSMPNSNASKSS